MWVLFGRKKCCFLSLQVVMMLSWNLPQEKKAVQIDSEKAKQKVKINRISVPISKNTTAFRYVETKFSENRHAFWKQNTKDGSFKSQAECCFFNPCVAWTNPFENNMNVKLGSSSPIFGLNIKNMWVATTYLSFVGNFVEKKGGGTLYFHETTANPIDTKKDSELTNCVAWRMM